MKDAHLNLVSEAIMFRSVSDKNFTIIKNVNIETFGHNVVLKFYNNTNTLTFLMTKYHLETDNESIIKMRNEPIHLIAENILIIIYSPVVERLELNGNIVTMNIISNGIEYFEHPIQYIRKTKIEKIKENIDERKKNL